MLYNNCRPLIIYLSRRGCLEYTIAVIKQLGGRNPILLINSDNNNYFSSKFPQLDIRTTSVPDSKSSLLTGFFSYQSVIRNLIIELSDTIGQVYFTAFHPYNSSLIKLFHKSSIPATITIHDYKTHTGERSWLTERIQKKCIRYSSRVNFLSDHVRNQALDELGSNNKFKVVPHPLVDSYTNNKLDHNPHPNLLFMGRMVDYKGINILLEAIKGLPINKLTIAGENQGITIPIQDKLNVISEYLPENDVAKLLETHEILILPYKEASQSGVLCLGIDAQMVMVITKVGGLREQLNESEAAWVEPSVDSLRAGLRKLIEEPDLYRNIKEQIKAKRKSLLVE